MSRMLSVRPRTAFARLRDVEVLCGLIEFFEHGRRQVQIDPLNRLDHAAPFLEEARGRSPPNPIPRRAYNSYTRNCGARTLLRAAFLALAPHSCERFKDHARLLSPAG